MDKEIKRTRALTIPKGAVDTENMTLELTFSSEEPVMMSDWEMGRYYEILSHEPTAVKLDRLKNGGPVLDNHDPDEFIGGVVDCYIREDRKCTAKVKFSRSEEGMDIYNDIVDGIRPNVSVGYRVFAMEKTGMMGDIPVYTVTDWEPFEISSVPIPADISVGVGRSADFVDDKKDVVENKNVVENKTNIEVTKSEDKRTMTIKEIQELNALGKQFNERELADEFIGKINADNPGETLNQFRDAVMQRITERQAKISVPAAEIGMSKKEVESFSLTRAISMAAGLAKWDGIEKEAVETAAKQYNRTHGERGFTIPHEVMKNRAATITPATAGGFMVPTVIDPSIIDYLYNNAAVLQMGVTRLSGLTGNVAINRVTGTTTAQWLGETEAITDSSISLGQLLLTPRRLGAQAIIGKQLIMQANASIENLIRMDIGRQLGLAIDRAVILGTGGSQPLGILNTTGISSVTYGAAPTWAKVVESETTLTAANIVPDSSTGWILDATTRGKWKTTQKATNYPEYLMGSDMTANGYKAAVTEQFATANAVSHRSLFGRWSDALFAEWAGVDVVVDTITLAGSNQIKVTYNQYADVGIRHAAAFVFSTDSAAQ